jgi:hypothetical protein
MTDVNSSEASTRAARRSVVPSRAGNVQKMHPSFGAAPST